MSKNTSSLIKVAIGLVMDGAQLAEAHAGTKAATQKESMRDIVTATDLAISQLISTGLQATGIPVISEEEHVTDGIINCERFWVIDPIDGTVNFTHHIPNFTISVGLITHHQFELGVVCAPSHDELYFTLEADTALFNGRAFRHPHGTVENALLAASFSAKASDAEYLLFKRMNETTRGCLRTGSASLNVCWAALGRLQAAYGFRAKLWDVAGGLAIARAAGCTIAIVQQPGSLYVDYCVGSHDVVKHFTDEATQAKLWGTA